MELESKRLEEEIRVSNRLAEEIGETCHKLLRAMGDSTDKTDKRPDMKSESDSSFKPGKVVLAKWNGEWLKAMVLSIGPGPRADVWLTGSHRVVRRLGFLRMSAATPLGPAVLANPLRSRFQRGDMVAYRVNSPSPESTAIMDGWAAGVVDKVVSDDQYRITPLVTNVPKANGFLLEDKIVTVDGKDIAPFAAADEGNVDGRMGVGEPVMVRQRANGQWLRGVVVQVAPDLTREVIDFEGRLHRAVKASEIAPDGVTVFAGKPWARFREGETVLMHGLSGSGEGVVVGLDHVAKEVYRVRLTTTGKEHVEAPCVQAGEMTSLTNAGWKHQKGDAVWFQAPRWSALHLLSVLRGHEGGWSTFVLDRKLTLSHRGPVRTYTVKPAALLPEVRGVTEDALSENPNVASLPYPTLLRPPAILTNKDGRQWLALMLAVTGIGMYKMAGSDECDDAVRLGFEPGDRVKALVGPGPVWKDAQIRQIHRNRMVTVSEPIYDPQHEGPWKGSTWHTVRADCIAPRDAAGLVDGKPYNHRIMPLTAWQIEKDRNRQYPKIEIDDEVLARLPRTGNWVRACVTGISDTNKCTVRRVGLSVFRLWRPPGSRRSTEQYAFTEDSARFAPLEATNLRDFYFWPVDKPKPAVGGRVQVGTDRHEWIKAKVVAVTTDANRPYLGKTFVVELEDDFGDNLELSPRQIAPLDAKPENGRDYAHWPNFERDDRVQFQPDRRARWRSTGTVVSVNDADEAFADPTFDIRCDTNGSVVRQVPLQFVQPIDAKTWEGQPITRPKTCTDRICEYCS